MPYSLRVTPASVPCLHTGSSTLPICGDARPHILLKHVVHYPVCGSPTPQLTWRCMKTFSRRTQHVPILVYVVSREGNSRGVPPEKSNCYCHPGKAGGTLNFVR